MWFSSGRSALRAVAGLELHPLVAHLQPVSPSGYEPERREAARALAAGSGTRSTTWSMS